MPRGYPKPKIVKADLLPDWQVNLRKSSMKVGFHLSLSRSMLEFLCATADGVHWDRSLYHHDMITPENWIASSCALIKRGLIERLTREEIDAQDRSQDHVEG